MIPFSGQSVAASSAQVAGLRSGLRLPVDMVRPSVPRSVERWVRWAALSLRHRRLGTATNPRKSPHLPNAPAKSPSSRRPMQPRPSPGGRLIVPDPEHALRSFDLVTGAPAGHEGTRDGRVEEVDRQGVIQHAAHPRGGQSPAICATICVEPRPHLIKPSAKSFEGNTYPDADGEPPFSLYDHQLRARCHIVPRLFSSTIARPS